MLPRFKIYRSILEVLMDRWMNRFIKDIKGYMKCSKLTIAKV